MYIFYIDVRALGKFEDFYTKIDSDENVILKKGKAAKKGKGFDSANLIGIDQPFSYKEVISITGPEYVHNLHHEGVAFLPYETLKENFARMRAKEEINIDVDIPFDRDEVAGQTGEDYAQRLTRSDVPVVEVTVPESSSVRLRFSGANFRSL